MGESLVKNLDEKHPGERSTIAEIDACYANLALTPQVGNPCGRGVFL
jgi:hypothetical protein